MHGYQFSEGQREDYRATILNNLISASMLISSRARDFEIEMDAVAQKVCALLTLFFFLIAQICSGFSYSFITPRNR